MTASTLLWADLRTVAFEPDLFSSLPSMYAAKRLRQLSDLLGALQSYRPRAVCFEYDVTDTVGLTSLAEVRRLHPALPLIVLAERKARAVQAFAYRQGVWDYLIKPVSLRKLCDCLMSVDKATGAQKLLSTLASVPASASPSSMEGQLAPALSYVATNFPEKVRLSTVAKLCDLSTFQFSRNFKKKQGLTFRDFVVQTRIRRAAELMRESTVSITEAAFVTGFNDLSYFSRMFRRQFGVSPSRFRHGGIDLTQLPLFPITELRKR